MGLLSLWRKRSEPYWGPKYNNRVKVLQEAKVPQSDAVSLTEVLPVQYNRLSFSDEPEVVR
jgi:hypothetical protein